MLTDGDLERITSLMIDNKHHHGRISVVLSIRRGNGEGLRDAAVSGPGTVAKMLQTAFDMADSGYPPVKSPPLSDD